MKRIEGRHGVGFLKRRKLLAGLIIACLALALSGCETFRFYRQAVRGEYQILAHRQPIQKLLADSRTAPELKQNLQLVLQLREFAQKNLRLPVDKQYF